jgi:hypothetical protein
MYIESTSTPPILQISSSGNKKNAPTDLATRAIRYHNFWAGKTFDKLEVSTVPVTCAKSVIRHSNAEFTGAINVG